MTMPTGQYGTRHIAWWSVLVASCEAPKRRHRASARAVLARRTPWSSSSSSQRIHKTQLLLASAYCTFLLAICENFIPQNGPSTQLIEATIFVKIWNGKIVAKELSYSALFLAGWGGQNWRQNYDFCRYATIVVKLLMHSPWFTDFLLYMRQGRSRSISCVREGQIIGFLSEAEHESFCFQFFFSHLSVVLSYLRRVVWSLIS